MMILAFLFGSILAIVGRVGADAMSLVSFILSEELFMERVGHLIQKLGVCYIEKLREATLYDYEMERKLILSELKRVRDFASLSKNLDYSYTELEEVLNFYNVPLLD